MPAVVDLAAMRDAIGQLGGDPKKINPLVPVDLVIDHSVSIDHFGTPDAFRQNVEREFERNRERYEFLRWGATAFDNFRVVPPGTGICHQVNVEYLAQTVWSGEENGETIAYPDTCVGTDSHTTMVNGLAVLGWGVGGIEAEAAMLGQPVSMLIPEVIGFRLTGTLKEGATATDLVLTVTQMLRARGVVGKFVEFFGAGLDQSEPGRQGDDLQHGAGIRRDLRLLPDRQRDPALSRIHRPGPGTGRAGRGLCEGAGHVARRRYARPAVHRHAGARPRRRRAVDRRPETAAGPDRADERRSSEFEALESRRRAQPVAGADWTLDDGDVVIASITSCTNTSNPAVLVAAGLLARKAREKGLQRQPWVKTSFAPGSQVVSDYIEAAGLQDDLDALGFNLVGYGCTTCIGNSGPLPEPIHDAVEAGDLTVCAVLSGNRNFEGRVHPLTRGNYLASPPLVVAYALAGSLRVDLYTDPDRAGRDGNDVFLKDIWPTNREVAETIDRCVTPAMFRERYADVFAGDENWQTIEVSGGLTYDWDSSSTYVRNPPYFEGMTAEPAAVGDIAGARSLARLGDSVTTDHISPAGVIKEDGPAGDYLKTYQIRPRDFNSFGSRRGNHEVMMRGTFANIRIRNEMAPGTEGGVTRHQPSGEEMPIYDAAMRYRAEGVPLVVVGGKEYGTGSSRDWAAKGTRLLGVRAVIVESFERIHRSNLVGMGVLPLQFKDGATRESLGLTGDETFDIAGIAGGITPGMDVSCTIRYAGGATRNIALLCRIDTADEVAYFGNGGILHYVLRSMAAAA